MVPPTGTQTEQGNLPQKRCDLKNVGFFWGGYICWKKTYEGLIGSYRVCFHFVSLALVWRPMWEPSSEPQGSQPGLC